MSSETFRAEQDVLGIVTQRRQDRARFARYRQHRPASPPYFPSNLKRIVRAMVDDWLAEKSRRHARAMAPPPTPERHTVAAILAAVTEATGYPADDLLGPRRTYPLVRARQMAYYLIRVLRADMSFPAIGRAMGGKDHTSIMQGLRRVNELQGAEPLASWMAHPAVVKLLGKPE